MASDQDPRQALGRGFAFPLDVNADGGMKASMPVDGVTEDDVREAVRQRLMHLVLTIAGQRPLRRGYGTHIADGLFGVSGREMVAIILREAIDAVSIWLPGLSITGAEVFVDEAEGRVTYQFGWHIVGGGLFGQAQVPIGLDITEGFVG